MAEQKTNTETGVPEIPDISELQNIDRAGALQLLAGLNGVRDYLMSFVADNGAAPDADAAQPESPSSSINTMLENEIQRAIADNAESITDTDPDLNADSESDTSTALNISSSTLYPSVDLTSQKLKGLFTILAPFYQSQKRAPIDLVIVADRSYSMEGSPITLLKETMKFIVTQLSSEDRLAVVTYGTDVNRLTKNLIRMDDQGKQRVEFLINSITANGNTNLSGGLVTGVEILRERPADDRADVCSVLLLTDGQANHGFTDPSDIMRACVDPKFARGQGSTPDNIADLGCTINTFGFSEHHDSNVLKQIAESGRGMFYFIPNSESIGQSFSDCLGGLLSTTSQNLVLTLTPAPGVTISKVYTKFKVEETLDTRVVRIPDMQSEEKREILLDILVGASDVGAQQLISATLEYDDVVSEVDRSTQQIMTIERTETPDTSDPDLTVDRANNREIATAAIEEAQTLGKSRELGMAKVVLTSAIEEIGRSPSAGDEFCLALVSELQAIKQELETRGYTSAIECSMATTSNAHGYQRSTGTNKGAQTSYVTSNRTTLTINSANYIK